MAIITPYELPVFFRSSEFNDYELTHSFPLELFLQHEGYEVEEEGIHYTIHIPDFHDHPRDTLILEITDWVGVSIGAVHSYGKLIFPRAEFRRDNTCSRSSLRQRRMLHQLELWRTLTKQDIDSNPKRYNDYRPGDVRPGFDNDTDVIDHAHRLMASHFDGFKLDIKRK